jgi:hypothetical protein
MALLTSLKQFLPDTIADANDVNYNFDAIASKFNFNIKDDDIGLDADIDGSKLSFTPAKQVPESRLGNNAVSDRVLAHDDNSPGTDSARAVGVNHIKANAVTTVKIADASVTAAKLAAGALGGFLTFEVVPFSVRVQPATAQYQAINPVTNFPKATWALLAMYITDVTYQLGTHSSPWADDRGATNWQGGAFLVNTDPNNAKDCIGSLVYVFAKK